MVLVELYFEAIQKIAKKRKSDIVFSTSHEDLILTKDGTIVTKEVQDVMIKLDNSNPVYRL